MLSDNNASDSEISTGIIVNESSNKLADKARIQKEFMKIIHNVPEIKDKYGDLEELTVADLDEEDIKRLKNRKNYADGLGANLDIDPANIFVSDMREEKIKFSFKAFRGAWAKRLDIHDLKTFYTIMGANVALIIGIVKFFPENSALTNFLVVSTFLGLQLAAYTASEKVNDKNYEKNKERIRTYMKTDSNLQLESKNTEVKELLELMPDNK